MGKLFKIALALLLIGIGGFVAFSIMSDDPLFATVNDEDYVYNELIYDASEFTNFDFDFSNRDFFIEPSEDDKIKIVYYTTDKDKVVVTDSTTTLVLLNKVEWVTNWFSGWGNVINNDYYDVYIYLPTSGNYDFDIDTSNGNLNMEDIANLESFVYDTSNGGITLNKVTANSLDLYTSNGVVTLTDVSVQTDIEIDSSNGKVLLTDVAADKIVADTSNGRILATRVDADEIELDTTNGNIIISVIGNKDNYQVDMSTSNGDLEYDGLGVTEGRINAAGENSISLDTSNGDIELTFTE